jgi:BirA family biotin operon repressor/biotin-[acetyl-CoA-carboxylase] ligase
MQLHPAVRAAGVRLAEYGAIGSTNAEALALARQGESGPVWLVADCQTAGRGRHGRTWVSEPGNLFATLLLSDPAPARHASELAFVTGIAVHDAVVEMAPCLRPRLMLKWPNDLLCDGAKLSGILIEGEGAAVAIGVGINCRHHPIETAYPATDLTACGVTASPETLLYALSKTMFDCLHQWQRGAAFATIRRQWLARAHAPGSAISVRIGEGELAGRYEGIDAGGRLLVRTSGGILEAIAAGDVAVHGPFSAAAVD